MKKWVKKTQDDFCLDFITLVSLFVRGGQAES